MIARFVSLVLMLGAFFFGIVGLYQKNVSYLLYAIFVTMWFYINEEE